jgi:hypothetical protein
MSYTMILAACILGCDAVLYLVFRLLYPARETKVQHSAGSRTFEYHASTMRGASSAR